MEQLTGSRSTFGILLVFAAAAAPAAGQGMPPPPVRFTEAREHPVQRLLNLPGTVESHTAAVVAAEVAGLVVELPAREGETVLKGEPIARLRDEEVRLRLRASEAQLKEAESRMKLAERSLERARELHASKVISLQQLDDAFYEYSAWQGRAEQYAADAARYRLDIERSTIRAPFAGVVAAERTEMGEWLDVGGPVVELVALDELEVRVEVPERHYSSLSPGAPAQVTFESLPGLEVKGKVSAIVPRAETQARTFPVKVRIPGGGGRIGVGMLAQVAMPAGESYRATVIPKDAVVSQGREKVVYLLNGDGTVSPVPVETGAGVGVWVAVNGGIQAGQKVITRGNERLFPGQSVRGEPLEYALP